MLHSSQREAAVMLMPPLPCCPRADSSSKTHKLDRVTAFIDDLYLRYGGQAIDLEDERLNGGQLD